MNGSIPNDDPDHGQVQTGSSVDTRLSSSESSLKVNGDSRDGPIEGDVDDLALLDKLDRANRLLEADSKSLQSISPRSSRRQTANSDQLRGLVRRDSISSIISSTSLSSNCSNLQYDDNNQDSLWAIWGNITEDWESMMKKKSSYVKDLIHRGIPHHFRGIVWPLLCNAHNCPEKERYSEYLKQTSPFEKTIRRDISRTYPDHEMFKEKDGPGQEGLFNVMKAYSLHDREVGYCQGSAFIVGLLLMQMPEEDAFAVLVKIMQDYGLRELFKPSMAELGLRLFQLEAMIQELLPELYNHFIAQGFGASAYASSWFLALFTTTLSLPVACRVFDVFLSEGIEIVFRVAIAILQLSMDELLALDMEMMIKFLQKDVATKVNNDPELLMATALHVKYQPRKLKKLEKEYNILKTKESEEQIELRRLRSENKQLKERIVNLEKETGTLASRLIQDQVKRAQQEEEMTRLKHKISVSRQQSCDTIQRMAEMMVQHEEYDLSSGSNCLSSSDSYRSVLMRPASMDDVNNKDKQIERLQDRVMQLQRQNVDVNKVVASLQSQIEQLQCADQTVSSSVEEELIACKLREAESNMSVKELQCQLHEVERQFQKYKLSSMQSAVDDDKASSRQLHDKLTTLQNDKARLLSETVELRHQVISLETESQQDKRKIQQLQAECTLLRHSLTNNNIKSSSSPQISST